MPKPSQSRKRDGDRCHDAGRVSRLELLDSALHALQASFGGEKFYPMFVDKAAVLTVRIANNHPLVDGNKRLAWAALNMFVMLNGHSLRVATDDAVATMLAIAAGDLDEAVVSIWLAARLHQPVG